MRQHTCLFFIKERDTPDLDSERVSGATVFKNTRLPVETTISTTSMHIWMQGFRSIQSLRPSTASRAHLAGQMVSGPFSSIVPRTNASCQF